MSTGNNGSTLSQMSRPEYYQWFRFTRLQRIVRSISYILVVALMYWALSTVNIFWPWVWSAPAQIGDMMFRMFPPSLVQLNPILYALVESINIALLGTIIAIILALPVAYFGAQTVTPNRVTLWLARLIIVGTRSVDTLVWALIFVAVFGPGSFAGIMAVAFHSVGFLSKLIAEAIEEIDWGPIEALESVGASRAHVIAYGIVPQVIPSFCAISILRWDINIRESTVLGLVGAGGIGLIFQGAIDLFQWNTVSMVLIVIVMVVFAGEVITSMVRRKLI
ncbi:phosphonate transport system permease protein [Alkalispirochaeta americana]|uniref:Phosphonate transport system permease protein n=1 Tax=Alkalispirochaeta americana TaxID=159291 RepID=A0A1N6N873_9SPIO|nr:phosphonate ABC transporter, permease protein PhnE [Alkalispirochaeta americana]SIP88256.1 phosphonate transport system permease protein [Alkalispirochaeta americana]